MTFNFCSYQRINRFLFGHIPSIHHPLSGRPLEHLQYRRFRRRGINYINHTLQQSYFRGCVLALNNATYRTVRFRIQFPIQQFLYLRSGNSLEIFHFNRIRFFDFHFNVAKLPKCYLPHFRIGDFDVEGTAGAQDTYIMVLVTVHLPFDLFLAAKKRFRNFLKFIKNFNFRIF